MQCNVWIIIKVRLFGWLIFASGLNISECIWFRRTSYWLCNILVINDKPYWLVKWLDAIFPWQLYSKYCRFWGYDLFFVHRNHKMYLYNCTDTNVSDIVTITWHYVRRALLITQWWVTVALSLKCPIMGPML